MEILNDFAEAAGPLSMLSRFLHVLSGVTWIGLLYFFNFVQVPAYAQLSDSARSEALRKLTFRALWWFRYAALSTFLFGVLIIALQDMDTYFRGVGGTAILTGALFGTTMFLNVWGIIWRNNKVVIASAETVANGGSADPNAPALAKAAGRASRCNTFFSFTMLFFMVFAAHGGLWWGSEGTTVGGTVIYWILVLVLWALVEASALGFIGGVDGPLNKLLFDDHRKTILYGFIFLAIIYFVGWEVLLPA